MFDHDDFDKDFKRTKNAIVLIWIFNLIITLSLLAGGVFVVYKVLMHFGIL